jgi:hypothetical protein
MPFFFEPFPTISYDLKKNGKPEILTNVTVRFKLQNLLSDRSVVFYDYNVKDGERPDAIAYKYYNDASLDWIILLINNIVNPNYEWPLDYLSFTKYLRKKYGSVQVAQSQVHHYEKILRNQSVEYDGTIIPQKTLWVDETTYDTLDPASRKSVSSYDYELEVNEDKRDIKILDKRYVTQLINEASLIFE